VSQTIKVGSILVKETLLFPSGVTVDSEAYAAGWKLVRNLDGYGLARLIVKAHWNFFYMADEMRAIAVGSQVPATLRRALNRIASKPEGQHYNSLEVTKVVAKRFFGIPFVQVAANFRHIQQGIGLTPTRNFILRTPVPGTNDEAATKRHTAMISSS
jgi:hypothetical protein